MRFLLTADVELTWLPENRERSDVAQEVLRTGLPRVLDTCARFDIPATFYFTANLVQLEPACIDLVREAGHEVGCHGLRHNPGDGYDRMSREAQRESLSTARAVLEEHGAGPVQSFRAPEARIGPDTVSALSELGFTSDSSVCPQRFDGPFSHGFRQKIPWLFAPRRPYFLSTRSIAAPGDTKVLEIPISALVFPFIGTTMRVSPSVCRLLRRELFWEARRRPEFPVVFLFHPNECLDDLPGRVAGAVRNQTVADALKSSLKLRNLGVRAVRLLEEILAAAKGAGFEFTTATRMRAEYGRD